MPAAAARRSAPIGTHHDVDLRQWQQLFFVTTDGSATVFGGTGSDTFFGGKGKDVVYGGSGGHNLLLAGTGTATLFGGGDGDQFYRRRQPWSGAACWRRQRDAVRRLRVRAPTHSTAARVRRRSPAGSGNDTFVAGTGSATITSGLGSNQFVFTNGQAGGTEHQGFTSGSDVVDLQDYGKNAVVKR